MNKSIGYAAIGAAYILFMFIDDVAAQLDKQFIAAAIKIVSIFILFEAVARWYVPTIKRK